MNTYYFIPFVYLFLERTFMKRETDRQTDRERDRDRDRDRETDRDRDRENKNVLMNRPSARVIVRSGVWGKQQLFISNHRSVG